MKKNSLLILFMLSCFQVLSSHLITLNDSISSIPAGSKMMILEEETNSLSFNEITTPFFQSRFKQGNKSVYNFGFSNSAIWCKIEIQNLSKKTKWILDVDNTSLENVTFYYPVQNSYDSIKYGASVPFDIREFPRLKNSFTLSFNNNDIQTYYLKISSRRPIQIPVNILSEKEFAEKTFHNDLLHGIYFGFMTLMIFYNLFIWFSVRDIAFLYYVFYVSSITIFNGMIAGSLDFVLNSYNWLFEYGDVITASTGIFALLFCIKFLHTEENTPRLHKFFKALILFYAVSAFLPILGFVKTGTALLEIESAFASIFVLAASFYIYVHGFKPAIFFIIGWSVLILCVLIFILKDFNLLPYNTFSANAIQFGTAFESLLFSFALASKINVYKKEKENAQAEMLKNALDKEKFVTQQNIILEQKIEERTVKLKETQEQLIQQEKLASLGQLTAGIAHEIQNPLNFVNNFSTLSNDLIEDIKSSTDEKERLDILNDLSNNLVKISHHGRRADSIVKSMLQHSNVGMEEKQLCDINKICSDNIDLSYMAMCSRIPDFNCLIEKKLNQDLSKSYVVLQDIARVILNLSNNAFYAIHEKQQSDKDFRGIVTLSTKWSEKTIDIRIRDNGIGVSEAAKKKIFQPFFTTKPSGDGTGLGLSISYDIVRAHGGEIIFESKKESGTVFTVILPRQQKNQQ